MAQLPNEYLEQMNELLKDEYPAFLATYEKPASKGLRVNTLKIGVEEFLRAGPLSPGTDPLVQGRLLFRTGRGSSGKTRLPCRRAVLHPGTQRHGPGGSPGSPAGRTGVGPLLPLPEGKRPKSPPACRGRGLLVANEIDPRRVKVLVENLDRLGVSHAVVLNEAP